jgi:leukotriene-A4 hydrolase
VPCTAPCTALCTAPRRPLYRALYKSKMGRQLALDTFAAHRASYHPIAQKMVAADLGL